MVAQGAKDARHLWILGLCLSLPWIMLAGPVAGWAIGDLVLVRQFHCPEAISPAMMMLGIVASGVQTYRILRRLRDAGQI